ncbi:MAG: PEP-CTERM sorting domain-containing protein [Verrucomicrobiales bacterium]|nr:PEP-CTERM sorting domain-containing protein [Verrucomicrobiales bacterium]
MASSWPEFFQVLTLAALLSLTPAASALELGPFSGGQESPGTLDSGIPGNSSLFVGWATGYLDYVPSPTRFDGRFWTPEKTLGPATGNVMHIASLGDMSAEDLVAYLADPVNAAVKPGTITLTFDYAITNGTGADFAVFENAFISNYTIPETGGAAGQGFCELGYVEVSTDGFTFARFPSIYLNTFEGMQFDDDGNPKNFNYATMEVTTIYNIAGKHCNGYGPSYGTPFDLDTLVDFDAVLACLDEIGFELTEAQLTSLLAQLAYNQSLVESGDLNLNEINFVRVVDIPGTGAFKDSLDNPIYDAWQTYGSGGFDLDAVGVLHQIPEPSTWALLVAGGGLLFILANAPSSRKENNSPLVEGWRVATGCFSVLRSSPRNAKTPRPLRVHPSTRGELPLLYSFREEGALPQLHADSGFPSPFCSGCCKKPTTNNQ